MKTMRLIVLAAALCAMVFQVSAGNDLKFNASKIRLTIVDERAEVDGDEIVIPFSPFPGQNDGRSPELPKDLKDEYQNILNGYLGKGTDPIDVEIVVLEARKGYSIGAAKKRELINIELRITVTHAQSGEFLVVGKGSVFKSNTKVNLNLAAMNEAFDNGLKEALKSFLADEDNIKIANGNIGRIVKEVSEENKPVSKPFGLTEENPEMAGGKTDDAGPKDSKELVDENKGGSDSEEPAEADKNQ